MALTPHYPHPPGSATACDHICDVTVSDCSCRHVVPVPGNHSHDLKTKEMTTIHYHIEESRLQTN